MPRNPRFFRWAHGVWLAVGVVAAVVVSTACGSTAAAPALRHARSACRRIVDGNVVRDVCDTESLAGASFWRYSQEPVVELENELLRARRYSEAAQVNRIAWAPMATWFASPVSAHFVRGITRQAHRQHQVPVDVLYDLPWRGCGQPGAGGASSPAAYRRLVRAVARGIGNDEVVMIVEPDALSELSCLSRHRRSEYFSLIRYAVSQLSDDRDARLYVDAGHPDWVGARRMARRLLDVARSTNIGFAVNVSNYYPTSMDITYGTAISRASHGKHFVIDTSRNGGEVKLGAWCNPPGARIGTPATTDTGDPLVDAELWIKSPGISDGTCNGGPPAGQLWLAGVLALTSPNP